MEACEEEEEPQTSSQHDDKKKKGTNLEDAVMASLQKWLQESGELMAQLQQAIRPQTQAEVCGTYVKGTLVSERKFKKAGLWKMPCRIAARKSLHKSHHLRYGMQNHPTTSTPIFSSSPKFGEQWQPAPDQWKSTRPPTASPWQSQDYGYMERYKAGMINQMLPPPPPPPPPPGPSQISHQYHQQQTRQHQFHKQHQHQNLQQHQQHQQQQQQHNHPNQQQSVSSVIGRSHQVLSTSLERDLAYMSSISGLSALLEISPTSGQKTPRDLTPPTLPHAGEKQ